MAKSKPNPLCLSAREALSPPPAEDTLRELYAIVFGWPAPEAHGEEELTEAILRCLGGVPEEKP